MFSSLCRCVVSGMENQWGCRGTWAICLWTHALLRLINWVIIDEFDMCKKATYVDNVYIELN